MLVTTHVGSQKGIGRRSSLCLVYIQELTRNAYDNLNYRSEKRLKRLQNDSTMALISFTKVARKAGAISFWLVYSSNITVCEALALSEGELERKTWGLVLYSQYTKKPMSGSVRSRMKDT